MPVPVIVLNFGHSVLNSLEDYTQAASEIYRHWNGSARPLLYAKPAIWG